MVLKSAPPAASGENGVSISSSRSPPPPGPQPHARTRALVRSFAASTMSEDALEDLEDLGGALSADGTRVARDLPPVVRVRHRRGADSPRPRASAPSREGAARDASASSGPPGGERADDACPEDAVVAARRADRASTSASDAVPLDAATAAGGPIIAGPLAFRAPRACT